MDSSQITNQLNKTLPERLHDPILLFYLQSVISALYVTPATVAETEKTLWTVLGSVGLTDLEWGEVWRAWRDELLKGRLVEDEDDLVGMGEDVGVVPFERPVQMDMSEGRALVISGSGAMEVDESTDNNGIKSNTTTTTNNNKDVDEITALLNGHLVGNDSGNNSIQLDWLANRKSIPSQVNKSQLEKAEARLRQKAEKRSRKEAGQYRAGKFGPSGQAARSAAEREAERQAKIDAILFTENVSSGSGGRGMVRDVCCENFDISIGSSPPKRILTGASCTLSYGRRYGLIGRNGVGKSTFLRHIAGRLIPGIPSYLSILHVEQEVVGDDKTALESVLEADYKRKLLLEEESRIQGLLTSGEGDEEREELEARLSLIYQRLADLDADKATARASMILSGLGFSHPEQSRATKTFSGGWRMRIALAQALFCQPDLLLLDEPTNMLDFPSVVWLQEYLLQWPSTILVVSHDRLFLDAITTDILHQHAEQLESYRGDYTQFVTTRDERLKNQQREYEAQLAYRQHLQAFVDRWRYNANRAPQAQSRLKILEKLPELKPVVIDAPIAFRFPKLEHSPPSPLVQLDEVDFGYGGDDRLILRSVNFSLQGDSRIAIVGPNGAGKTTLLKLITGRLEPTKGRASLNARLRVGYFSQHHVDQIGVDSLTSMTPVEWLASKYPGRLDEEYRRQLGSFGLSGPLALQSIHTLSGGQKSRLAFAALALTTPHLLILDEPTNHLDMDSIDALIESLRVFDGAVIAVSHDKRFVDLMAKEIWVCANARVGRFDGSIHDYARGLGSNK